MNRWKYRPIMSLLYKRLGFTGNKIPMNYELVNQHLFIRTEHNNEQEGFYCTITIKKGEKRDRKSSKHRLFCLCPSCQTLVPLGRLHQHIGTGRCKKIAAQK